MNPGEAIQNVRVSTAVALAALNNFGRLLLLRLARTCESYCLQMFTVLSEFLSVRA